MNKDSTNKSDKTKKSNKRTRKVVELDSDNSSITTNKRFKTDSCEKGEKAITETRLVPYKPLSLSSDSEDGEEEQKLPMDRIGLDYSSNPLSTYNTFVCHLGDWANPLGAYLKHPAFRSIFDRVKHEYTAGLCFPPKELIFNAFQKTPYENLKVVMVGSNPFFRNNDAMGMSFSVPRNAICPSKTLSIYKALAKDPKVNFTMPNPLHGDLQSWANKGILMLNNSLTVKEDNKKAHSRSMWNKFTQAVLSSINKTKEGVIFLCWGPKAKEVCKGINKKKHYVLTYDDPSPLTQKFQKFEDCTNFSKVNEILEDEGKSTIDWNLD